MKLALSLYVAIVAGYCTLAFLEPQTPAGAEAPQTPKQLPYLIALRVCGAPHALILTTNPPIALLNGQRDELVERLMVETPKERVIRGDFRPGWCPLSV